MKQLIIYVLSTLFLFSCIKEKQKGADLAVGDKIPDFSVIMNDGTEVTGQQLSQGKSCIVFFTTLCPDCREVLPHLQLLYQEFVSKDVKFVLISREEGNETISSYWIAQGFTMPYSAQEDRRVYELFAKTRVPRVYLCKNGKIEAVFTDEPQNPDYDTLKTAIENL